MSSDRTPQPPDDGFVDIHTHVLPGLDDGAPDMATSLEMLRLAEREGISVVVATPHTSAGRFVPARELAGRGVELQAKADEQNIAVRVTTGMEWRLSPELMDYLESDGDIGLGGGRRFVLVELPWQEIPIYTRDLMFRMQLAGATPVLAHPERHEHVQAQPAVLEQLVDQGCLVQLTCSSLIGEEGQRAAATSRLLLARDLVHVVASDAHRPGHRLFHFRAAYEELSRLLGREQADRLTKERPRQMVASPGVSGDRAGKGPP